MSSSPSILCSIFFYTPHYICRRNAHYILYPRSLIPNNTHIPFLGAKHLQLCTVMCKSCRYQYVSLGSGQLRGAEVVEGAVLVDDVGHEDGEQHVAVVGGVVSLVVQLPAHGDLGLVVPGDTFNNYAAEFQSKRW